MSAGADSDGVLKIGQLLDTSVSKLFRIQLWIWIWNVKKRETKINIVICLRNRKVKCHGGI